MQLNKKKTIAEQGKQTAVGKEKKYSEIEELKHRFTT